MKQIKLTIKTKTQKYPIIIGYNLHKNLGNIIKKNSIEFRKCFLIVDKKVPKKFILNIKRSLKQKEIYIYSFNATEKNKNFDNIYKILELILSKNFSREDCIISIGGGITGDTSSLIASLYKRGLKFINLPTTLLAQVDSSIGGKTGINSKHGKNLIGSFYQPNLVLADTVFLKTLPKREIICGYGEIFKHSLINSKRFFNFLNKNYKKIFNLSSPYIEKAIYESCKIKKGVVEKDEKERGLRKILNFGHTFAHAYEASQKYNKKLNHGEAVILGIKTALNFSLENSFLKKNEYESIINHINNAGLPSSLNKFFKARDLEEILSFMVRDKKNNSSKISLVLLKKVGSPIFNREYTKKKIKLFLNHYLTN